MGPQVNVPSGLDALPARPPTPPREKAPNNKLSKTKQALARRSLDSSRSLHTPPGHSPDRSDSSEPTSRRMRKKVGFSSQTEYCDAPTYADNARKQPTPVSASSTTSACKPIKSILKPTPPVFANPLEPSPETNDPTSHANIATMLESTVKQLAGADRDSKMDAYMMLVRALKASNNLPDRIALQDKMSLFMQFIQRDVTAKTSDGGLDTPMVNRALTLLATFLHFPAIASTLSNDFGVFIMDHCIRTFEDASVPKDVIRHLMCVAASQQFPPKVMTADRVARLVASLHSIEERRKGKSIIMARIFVYRKLVKQAKSHMVSHSDWLLDLFTDMLSSIRDIRNAAIDLGLEASFSLGKEKQVSRRVMEILQLTVDETTYIEYYVQRLKPLARDKHESAAVPQIWSVIILLLRYPLERWEFLTPLMKIIQECFNSSNTHTKLEANYAWNRLIYALQFNPQSFSKHKTIITLSEPFMSQLKRRKPSEEFRKVLLGSICNFCYYAFKPNTSPSYVDSFWDHCLRPFMLRMVNPEVDGKVSDQSQSVVQDNTQYATLLLTGLFDISTHRIWKEDHINGSSLVNPEELPPLDPKWVRRNAPRVFTLVELILSRHFLELSDKASSYYRLWYTLVHTVAVAASKEVKVSTDTAAFMASAITFLFKMWSCGIPESDDAGAHSSRFFSATHEYLSTMVESLGLLPFTEKQLSMNKQNTFIPVATPSHRPTKGQALVRTPLHHLFAILTTLPPGAMDNDDLSELIRSFLKPFLVAKSPRARLDLVQELMQATPMDSLSPYGPWVAISEVISDTLESSQGSHSSADPGSETPIGHEYREIVKHLERGVRSTPHLPWEHWHSLFQTLVTRAVEETGEAGCAIGVIEPLSKILMDRLSSGIEIKLDARSFKSATELISNAKQPRDRQALDAGRRRLWGTAIGGSRAATFDPFDHFYRLTTHFLFGTYRQLDDEMEEDVVVLLTEVGNFLARCNQLLVFRTLVNLQDGIGVWVQDAQAQFGSRRHAKASQAVNLLWSQICNIFVEADNLEHVQLDAIEPLLCSAFQSKHRNIVNTAAILWNRAFEHADEVQYPEKLKSVLITLRPYIDIVLPGLDASSFESSGRQPSFIESQDDSQGGNVSAKSGSKRTASQVSRPSSSGPKRSSVPAKHRLESTPDGSRAKSARRGATPRIRHDDSQVQFAAIESSSPILDAAESQNLTDRQKEVRERQRENAALFPEIQSSAEKRRAERLSSPDVGADNPMEDETTITPKTHRSFEDYVSSTPTPRRGQAPAVEYNDQDMTDDLPSSPPEPRRYPLLPEITQSQRSSSSVLEDWALMSSPTSGSPLQDRQISSRKQRSVDISMNDEAPETKEAEDLPKVNLPADMSAAPEDEEDVYQDRQEPAEGLAAAEGADIVVGDVLPTTRKEPEASANTRSSKQQEMAGSDNDIFVDALDRPTTEAATMEKSELPENAASMYQGTGPSFEVSDLDERSLLRLVVELDSRKDDGARSEVAEEPTGRGVSPVLDCITVNTGSKQARRSTRNKSRPSSSPAALPSTPVEIGANDSQPSSPPTSKKSKKNKRKRAFDNSQGSSQESDTNKKRKSSSQDFTADADVVDEAMPDNDDAPAPVMDTRNVSLEDYSISGGELLGSSLRGSSNNADDDEQDGATRAPAVDVTMDENEAASQQLVREASQGSRVEGMVVEEDPEGDEAEEIDDSVLVNATFRGVESVDTSAKEATGGTTAEAADVKVIATQEAEEDSHQDRGPEPVMAQSVAVQAADEAEQGVSTPEDVQPLEKSPMSRIMSALQGGLSELRTATLSRDDVYRIEGMFMDIKRELYEAESRSRDSESRSL